MSIFGTIKDLIFGGPAAAAEVRPSATGTGPTQTPAPPAAEPPAGTSASTRSGPAAANVAAILDKLADRDDLGDLDWRRSIVDLMKILGIDSSLKARKQLADELGFTGDKGDSAKMNVWLHKQVMTQLAANGGKVPAALIK